jgi:hypothetical protein
MPAPQFLAILPKPILFGLYGAIGGLLGALVFGEPAWQILRPPPPPPAAQPEPQLAVAASKELQLLLGKGNSFPVEIVRDAFDGPVDVKLDDLPGGVIYDTLTIAKGETTGKVVLKSSARSAEQITKPIKVVASAAPNGKKVTAETTVSLQVIAPPAPQADVFFVLDVTGSMSWAINGVRDGIGGFAAKMRENKIDYQIGLLAFRDLTIDPVPMDLLMFDRSPFTTDVDAFRTKVGRLVSMGGGDDPESSLEAVDNACQQPFRKGATKVLLLITDAPPKVKPGQNIPQTFDEELAGAKKTAVVVKDKDIDAVNLVVRPQHLKIFEPLMEAGLMKGGGQFFDLETTVTRGEAGFTSLLDKFTTSVVEAAAAKNPVKPTVAAQAEKPVLTTKSLQSSEQFVEGSQGRLMLMSAVWAGAIAALVCFALLAGQHHYLRGSMPSVGTIVVGLAGGLMAGLLGGACGYGLYWISPNEVFRVLGWSLLGGLAGLGLSLFIPNLKLIYGLAGGAMGGAAGGVGFILLSGLAGKLIGGNFGDVIGRLSGGLIVGLCIGLMVAIVEAAFRSAWLEVRYGARETITVNLGPEPVKIGGDNRACTVWARGAAPVALRYFIRGGQVVCEDTPNNRVEAVVRNGDSREVGNVTVTVRTGSSATPAGTTARKPSAAPPLPRSAVPAPPPPPPALKPLDLDPFDDDPLPLPMSPAAPPRPAPAAAPGIPPRPASSVPPAAPPRPPVPTAGTKPASPRPASPPPAAKPPAGPRDPDACPSCGRKNPGRAGSRYCMLCDQTY